MIDLPPVLQALIDAAPDGWTQTAPLHPVWTHTNGLECDIQVHSLDQWSVHFVLGTDTLYKRFPRTFAEPMCSDMAPLLIDIQAWIRGLDLEPQQRIARLLAGWLALHGNNGAYVLSFASNSPNLIGLHAQDAPGQNLNKQIAAPPEMPQWLHADLSDLWRLEATPNQSGTSPTPMRISGQTIQLRHSVVDIPTSMHARLELADSFPRELRHLPAPEMPKTP